MLFKIMNRSGIIIRPKQSYIDWASSLDGTDLSPTLEDEPTIYLLPMFDNDSEALQLLLTSYDAIFKKELSSWHLSESDWPNNRSIGMFHEWFDVTFVSCVEDMCEEPNTNNL